MSDVNGGFERFGHEGNPGQWNPTLWALGIGVPTLIVAIMALSVYFVRPTADSAVLRMQRLKFHVAAWLFGMVVPIAWALIERQDNGGFERWSNNSRPGDWDPWILIVGGVWALARRVVVRRAAGIQAAHRRSVTFAQEARPGASRGSRSRKEGLKMSVTREERELGLQQPLSVPGKYLEPGRRIGGTAFPFRRRSGSSRRTGACSSRPRRIRTRRSGCDGIRRDGGAVHGAWPPEG